MTERPTFRIVVPTHRRPDLLARLLEALTAQLAEHPEFHLVVVNDGTHDSAYERLISGSSQRLTYLKLPEHRGYGPTRQAGCDGATEDYLVATDDDCVPPPLWLARLAALADTYPAVDLFAGFTGPIDPPRGWLAAEIAYIPNATPAPFADEQGLVTAVTANAMYRRELFVAAGGFAPDLRGAAEDCYITQRILATGGTALVAPELVTGHRAIQSLREMRRKFRAYGRGAAQYVVREQDWRVAALHSDGSLRGSLAFAWASALAQWHKPENILAGMRRRLTRCVLTLLSRLAYESGWRQGLRLYSRQYGRPRPAKPPLGERYSDFCREIVMARREP